MRKGLAAVLALTMIASLAGCGGGSGSTSQSATQAAETQAEATTEAAVSSGKMGGGATTTEKPDISTEGRSEDLSITISNYEDLSGIAPFAAPQNGRNDIRYLIYDQLAIMEVPGGDVDEMAWQMAKAITKVDDDTWDVEIYDYIHDWAGNPVTADDVVFSYMTMAESGVSGKFSRLVDSVEKLDDYLIRIHLKNNALGAIQYVLQFCPIVSQTAYESQTEGELSQYPIGTGGYKIVDYVSGAYCDLERVDDYWQTDESLRSYAFSGQAARIRIMCQTEAAQRTNAMLTGSADLATLISSTDIGQFRNDDGTAKEGYNVLSFMNGTTYTILFNCSDDSPMSNLDLRKAVAYAIDVPGVMDGTYGKGGYLGTNDTFNSELSDYNPEWDEEGWYSYDQDKAKEHLEASGMSDVELTLLIMSDDDYKAIGVFVQQYLNMIGINVNIASYDSALFAENKLDSTKWDMMVELLGNSDYATDAWNLCISADTRGGRNAFMLDDPTFDEMVAAAGDLELHSQETVNAVHDYALENCFYLPLGNYYKYAVATDKLLVWPLHPYQYLLSGGYIFE